MTMESNIKEYISNLNIPDDIQLEINRCRYDLYYGPLYLDEDGEDCSCFDEGAHQFDFSGACTTISDYFADHVPCVVYHEDWSGCILESLPEGEEVETGVLDEDGEPILEWVDPGPFSEVDLWSQILGKDLVRYV